MTPALAPTTTAPRHTISAADVERIQSLARKLAARYPSAEDPELLRLASVFSHELPRDLRAVLQHFRLCEPSPGYLLLSGYPIDHARIGSTPAHWQSPSAKASTREEEIALVLIGSLLGDVFGWATQQGGRLVHEVFPIKGHEHEQLGSSSTELLTWHTEDAFHSCRGDYLVLLCLRNTQRACTTVGTLPAKGLPTDEWGHLSAAQYSIRPDESHLPKNRPPGQGDAEAAPPPSGLAVDEGYARIEEMNQQPPPMPVLHGHPDAPYLRLDPYFMNDLDADTPAAAALRSLISAIDADMSDIVLEAGDILCLDNYRVVHGRKPFEATFTGNDRWLKRINVTRDLRKSRHLRASAESRIICG